jgi:alkanesulfonate monooxygenase SsuD/methylene tetrahydromethanopterin reductase-like flavin-dependent oxidoreductase (luciferase family)
MLARGGFQTRPTVKEQRVIEIGVFHNGAADLPLIRTADDVVVSSGSLDEVQQSFQRVLAAQVRQGTLAEQLGYDDWFMTEHHFQPEGAEFSPSPLLAEAAIAAQTRRIRLGQMANIIPWWHPLRIAEQAAMLDVISGGRLEFGIGRGYQPREAETWGWRSGSTIQDQERNRTFFEEAFAVIMAAWTQPSFSWHGEYWSIPPRHTKWQHPSTLAYFEQPTAGRSAADVVQAGATDPYAAGPPLMASTTTLRELSVFPQPLQKPHPQVWEPITSERSIRWAARNKVNAFTVPGLTSRLKRGIEVYYEEAERHGWPDRLDRGRWRYGWDGERRRGFGCCRWVHLLPAGARADEDLRRYKQALELQWDYYRPFGLGGVLTEPGQPPLDPKLKIPAELIIEQEVAIVGIPEQVTEQILRIKETCGYEDFMFTAWFEGGGYAGGDVEEQMQRFAADVMPALRRACGGGPSLPESDAQLRPNQVAVHASP